MSASIDPLSGGLGILGSLVSNAANVRQQLSTLAEQVSSGYQATDYSGLAPGAAQTALDLAPQISALAARQAAIDAAAGPMGVAQTALTQIGTIANNLYAALNSINTMTPSQTDSVAAQARDELTQMAGLLNSQDAGNYVFAGQDSAAAPVPSGGQIGTSGFVTQISTAVAGLGGSGAAATSASIFAIASSNALGTSPFSASLSQAPASVNAALPMVSDGSGQQMQVGIAASTNAFVSSTGSPTTGSYMRDIMAALATVGSLSSTQINSGADVMGLVQDVRTSLGGAITALGQDQGELGNRQTQLQNESTTMGQTSTALSGQLAGADQVNTATVLTTLSATQTRLQASYQLISGLTQLSLTKYI